MKTSALLAVFFFFLVALFASTRAEYVRDKEGHLVANGGIYYLMPQDITGAAIDGVSIDSTAGNDCSLAVVEQLLNTNGNAIRIESGEKTGSITTDNAVQISFSPLPPNQCTIHPEWLVTKDEDFRQYAVMVGEESQFPYPVSGQLYFKTHNFARHQYNLVFKFSEDHYGTVSVKTDGYENRRLIVADEQGAVEPFVFVLVKSSGDRVASHVSMVV